MVRSPSLVDACILLLVSGGAGAGAQQPVTRLQAVDAALSRGARIAIARADTSAARAQLITARGFQNPGLNASYTKAVPQYHFIFDVPLDYPWLRRSRVGAAALARGSAQSRYTFERAAVALDADTTYTRALVTEARQRLSRHNAEDADSLLTIARVRREAGDASELDVQLATVNAGQQANLAATDSLARVSALLDLQTTMGLPATAVTIALADSLVPEAYDSTGPGVREPLQVVAAVQALESAEQSLAFARRSAFGPPTLTFGVEGRDPTGAEPGALPTIGVAFPLPFLNRNQGSIAAAQADRDRAFATLTLARLESQSQITRAIRQRAVAYGKLARDRQLLTSANRVATMSLAAYREGAVALPNVLEAQRTAREILGQYIDDVAAANIATATVRLFTLTAASTP